MRSRRSRRKRRRRVTVISIFGIVLGGILVLLYLIGLVFIALLPMFNLPRAFGANYTPLMIGRLVVFFIFALVELIAAIRSVKIGQRAGRRMFVGWAAAYLAANAIDVVVGLATAASTIDRQIALQKPNAPAAGHDPGDDDRDRRCLRLNFSPCSARCCRRSC